MSNDLSGEIVDFVTNTMVLGTVDHLVALLKQRGVSIDNELIDAIVNIETVALKAGCTLAEATRSIAAMAAAD